MKKIIPSNIIILSIGVTLLLVIGFLLKVKGRTEEHVAYVNGVVISREEFQAELKEVRPLVYSYFSKNYSADVSHSGFWYKDFNGSTPTQYAKEMGLNRLIKRKVEQGLAVKYGLIDDISYGTFCKKYNKENKRRLQAVNNKEIIYGPIQYDLRDYYDYLHSNLLIGLKNYLGQHEYNVSRNELMAYYERDKNKMYIQEEETRVNKMFISYMDQGGNLDKDKKRQAEKIMKDIHKALNAKGGVESLNPTTLIANYPLVITEEQVFNYKSIRADEQIYPQLKAYSRSLDIGEFSPLIDEANAINIIQVLDRKEASYKPFDEVEHIVQLNYVNEKFRLSVEELINKANVQVNMDNYHSIKMEN